MVLSSKASSKFGTKLVDPESNRFVTNIDISLSQQILNITNAEIETIVEPNRILNDRRREPVSFIDVFHLDMLPEHRLTCQYRNKSWIHWRWQCPTFLRQTFVEWAAQTINKSYWAGLFYHQQRAKGCTHQATLRALAFKWIRILYRCWKTRTPYDEAKYLKALKDRGSPLLQAQTA